MTKQEADAIALLKQYLVGKPAIHNSGKAYTISQVTPAMILNSEHYQVMISAVPDHPEAKGQTLVDEATEFFSKFRIRNVVHLDLKVIMNIPAVCIAVCIPNNQQQSSINFEPSNNFLFEAKQIPMTAGCDYPNLISKLFSISKELKHSCKVIGGIVKAIVKIDGAIFESNALDVAKIADFNDKF